MQKPPRKSPNADSESISSDDSVVIPQEQQPSKKTKLPDRRGGRPKGRFDPTIDWAHIRNIFVRGELHEGAEGPTTVYPSLRELAKRYGVSNQRIHQKISEENWIGQRDRFQQTVTHKTDERVAEARAVATVDGLVVLDEWIDLFRKNLQEGRVRADSLQDLNTALRLRKFLEGEAESRHESKQVITLEQLERIHQEQKAKRERESVTTGVIDTDGEETTGSDQPVPALPVSTGPGPVGGSVGGSHPKGMDPDPLDQPPDGRNSGAPGERIGVKEN